MRIPKRKLYEAAEAYEAVLKQKNKHSSELYFNLGMPTN
jgi:hypothetical protein